MLRSLNYSKGFKLNTHHITFSHTLVSQCTLTIKLLWDLCRHHPLRQWVTTFFYWDWVNNALFIWFNAFFSSLDPYFALMPGSAVGNGFQCVWMHAGWPDCHARSSAHFMTGLCRIVLKSRARQWKTTRRADMTSPSTQRPCKARQHTVDCLIPWIRPVLSLECPHCFTTHKTAFAFRLKC